MDGGAVMKENLLIDKSIAFASRIIKLHQYLIKTKKKPLFQSKSFVAAQVLAQISTKQITVKAKLISFPRCT